MGDNNGEKKSILSTIAEGIQNSLGKNFNKENTEAEPSKKKGFFYSFSSENELEGVEKVLEVGREQINNLQKKHAGLEDKLQAEVTKCTEEQENIKKEIEKVQADMDRLSGMIETSRASATGTMAGNSSDSSSFSESSMDYNPDVQPDNRTDNLPDNRTDNLPDNRTDNLPDNRTDVQPDNRTDNRTDVQPDKLAEKPNKNELEAVLPGLGGTRRRKKRRTKRRRRRGCSRKRLKWTRGRGR